MVVEKPGVAFDGEIGPSPGRSEGCSLEFRARYELDDWVDVLRRALADASPRAGVALLGVSEGGTAAARLSQEGFTGSIGVVSGGACLAAGALIERAYERERIGHPGTGLEETLRLLEEIAAAPDAIDRYAWGQTFRRWSTFGAACNVRALEPYPGQVFIAYGTSDDGADIAAFEDFARLRQAAGLPVRLHPVRGGDHDLMVGEVDHRESTFEAFLEYAFPEA
jgi:alpha-beta hydrolase superfamily lysophospholipase